MNRYYVYIVRCKDGSYYTGVTNDIERRINEHNSDDSAISYTSTRRPVELVFFEEFNDIMQAIELEKQIKGWSRKKKEAFISQNWDELKLLSKNYNQSRSKEG